MCQHLEAVHRGEIKRLLVAIPPGFAKSLTVGVFWFVWCWINDPSIRWLYTSYAEDFSLRDAIKSRDLIASSWFQENFGEVFKIRSDQDSKSLFVNDKTGFRLSTGLFGQIMGIRPMRVVVDEPHKAGEVDSNIVRQAALDCCDQVLSRSFADPMDPRMVVVMQRLHRNDLIGHLLDQGGFEYFYVPMEFETKRYCATSIWQDPRKEEGELAWPRRFGMLSVERLKTALKPRGSACQLQQNPLQITVDSNFKPEYFRYFKEELRTGETGQPEPVFLVPDREGNEIAVRPDQCFWFQTVDTAMKTEQKHDFTVVLTSALTPDNNLLIYDVARGKIPVPHQYQFVLAQREKNPLVSFQAVEEKNSGTGILQEGRLQGTPFRTLKAEADKSTRAGEIGTWYADGKVFHKNSGPWRNVLESELLEFPTGTHDDIFDCLAYAGILARQLALTKMRPKTEDRMMVLWPPPPKPGEEAERFSDFERHRAENPWWTRLKRPT